MGRMKMETSLGQLEIHESGYTAENYPGYVVSLVRNGQRFECALVEVDQTDKDESLLKVHVWDDKEEDPVFDLTMSAAQIDASEMGFPTTKEESQSAADYEKVKELLRLSWAGDDLMSQETLFELQDRITAYALEVAKRENKCEDLVKSFPFLYEHRDKADS